MRRRKQKKHGKHDKKGKRIKSKKRGGIWTTNKFGKIKSKKQHPPKSIVKRCLRCGARVLHHHLYCDKHWLLKQKENEKKDIKESELEIFDMKVM